MLQLHTQLLTLISTFSLLKQCRYKNFKKEKKKKTKKTDLRNNQNAKKLVREGRGEGEGVYVCMCVRDKKSEGAIEKEKEKVEEICFKSHDRGNNRNQLYIEKRTREEHHSERAQHE